MITILDLDNCISDDAWRIPRINFNAKDKMLRYHDYHLLAGFDQPCIDTLPWAFHGGYVVFTARPVMYRALTMEWLQRNMPIQPLHVLMRNDADGRSSAEVKADQLRCLLMMPEYGIGQQDVGHAYDDHPAVVEMYRHYGIPATQHAIHNVDAYVNPATGERHE